LVCSQTQLGLSKIYRPARTRKNRVNIGWCGRVVLVFGSENGWIQLSVVSYGRARIWKIEFINNRIRPRDTVYVQLSKSTFTIFTLYHTDERDIYIIFHTNTTFSSPNAFLLFPHVSSNAGKEYIYVWKA
jgi:hypothetical protein